MDVALWGILTVLGGYWLYRTYQRRPEIFSAKHMHKSGYVMGCLALMLIVVIVFEVWALRQG